MNQVNYGIGQGMLLPGEDAMINYRSTSGQITLRNLRLKKGALDKFRLPVDVLEGTSTNPPVVKRF
jgi:hypothetical protein